jgi:predicted glycoside hydrolase/deacetylase ChbG (UPF0249 family)
MPTTPDARRLIVNADDLAYDPEIDRGILEAHARGIVTSATAMVATPFAEAAFAAAPRSLALGLHVVLDPKSSESEAEREIEAQIATFERLRGQLPTHLDSHKHAHAAQPILAAMANVAAAHRLPVRALGAAMRRALRQRGVRTADHFLGDATLRPCWTPDRLEATLLALEVGVTEIMCHPGYRPAQAKTSFGIERESELAAVCDPRVRTALSGAALISYAAL